MDLPIRPLFDPRAMPARDAYGCAFHPDFIDSRWAHEVLGEEHVSRLKLAEAGWELSFEEVDAADAAGNEIDFATVPAPDRTMQGWQLVGIGDTEDGYGAWFIKPVAGAAQRTLIAACRSELDGMRASPALLSTP